MHPLIQATVDAYLARAGSLVDGLYLTGSAALGDFRPGRSDIDFVALVSRSPDPAALRAVHAGLPGPHFDGIYLTRAELAAGPRAIGPTPFAHEGRTGAGRFEHTPVTWHTLASHGVRCHGPALAGLDIWTDPAALAAEVRANLNGYWAPWHAARSRLLSPAGLACLGSGEAVWGVLGAPRLHYTLATGLITTKTGAGGYALETFGPRWHPIVRDCLRLRAGGRSSYRNPAARRRDALDFVATVLHSAAALAAAPPAP